MKSQACKMVVAVTPKTVAKIRENTLQSSFPVSSNNRKAAVGSTGASLSRLCIFLVASHLVRRHGLGGRPGQFIGELRRKSVELLD